MSDSCLTRLEILAKYEGMSLRQLALTMSDSELLRTRNIGKKSVKRLRELFPQTQNDVREISKSRVIVMADELTRIAKEMFILANSMRDLFSEDHL